MTAELPSRCGVYIPRSVASSPFVCALLISSSSPTLHKGSITRSISSKQALRRRADNAFPVDYRTIWLNSDLEEIKNAKLLAALELPYTKQPRPDGGRDVNLGNRSVGNASRHSCSSATGRISVGRARGVAEGVIRNDPRFQERCGTKCRGGAPSLTVDIECLS